MVNNDEQSETMGLTNSPTSRTTSFAPKLSGERQLDRQFGRRLQSRPKRQQ